MNILYLTQRIPYPPNRGDKIASFNAVQYLARRHSVWVAALAASFDELAQARHLESLGIGVDVALRTPLGSRWGALCGLARGESLSVAYYRSRDLAQKVRTRARSVRFDVVVAFSSSMGQYAECVPDVPLVADFVDMDSRKWELYSTFHGWPRSSLYALEERRLLAYERSLARRAFRTLVRTEAERLDCERLIPGGRFGVLSNGVDLAYFRSQGRKPSTANIVFTGVMDYFPNVQGVIWFCTEVLPRIQLQVPEATFTIVGAQPTAAVLALGEQRGVTVTGRVTDIRPYIHNAAVAVAPLLLARGVQNKVLEAMAMTTPVVLTQASMKGVDAPPGEGLFPAESAEVFADNVVMLLRNRQLASEAGSRGRTWVEKRYVWDDQLACLEAILLEAAPTAVGDPGAGAAGAGVKGAAP